MLSKTEPRLLAPALVSVPASATATACGVELAAVSWFAPAAGYAAIGGSRRALAAETACHVVPVPAAECASKHRPKPLHTRQK